jgi:hypothetical protein
MGQPEAAAVLLGTESTIRPIVGRRVTWFESTGEEASIPARATLGDERFDAAFARGRSLPLVDAVSLALALEPAPAKGIKSTRVDSDR